MDVGFWENEAKKLSDFELVSKVRALDDLLFWECFKDMGFEKLALILSRELESRRLGQTIIQGPKTKPVELEGGRSCENCAKRYKDEALGHYVCGEYDAPAIFPVVCSAHEFIGGD
jgi:hypothetical protein